MEQATVFVVDDDEAMRDSLTWLLESKNLKVACYASGEDFIAAYNPGTHGCLVVDVRMPGMSGTELHEKLKELNYDIPVIFITGHGDVPMAVRAVKRGAVDFLEKPFNDRDLLNTIEQSLEQDRTNRDRKAQNSQAANRLASLTAREREVMDLVCAGKLNKIIADELGISIKTVEAHRAKVMEKVGVHSVAELVQIVMASKH
ncbi:response regulator transcription factor [Chitinivorax sp. B]|uniref:response regulator transcription factor n=1 Tax=Chitinivorax sp. B TaxID=2502235 RepID=UPI0010F8E164|nr:response regulator transcription factor [Chitinivorax sp. B]